MSTALITGGSGHVGSNLVRKLTEKGYKIRTIDFDGDHRAFEGFDVELIKGDITDYESLHEVLLGKSNQSRSKPIFFRRPPDRDSFYGVKNLPDLAMRFGKWKFLCEYDGSNPELYDMTTDVAESTNVANDHAEIVENFQAELVKWHQSMPQDNGAKLASKKK